MRHGKRLRGRIEWLVFPHVREGVVVVGVLVRALVDNGGPVIYIYMCVCVFLPAPYQRRSRCMHVTPVQRRRDTSLRERYLDFLERNPANTAKKEKEKACNCVLES